MRVLIVEDEGLVAMHLEMLVTELGHHVCAVASTAAEAIHNAKVHKPDIVLLDLHLGKGSSGIDAAKTIFARHKIRSIVLSANIDASVKAALQPFEPVAFLGKPFFPVDLERAFERVPPPAMDNCEAD